MNITMPKLGLVCSTVLALGAAHFHNTGLAELAIYLGIISIVGGVLAYIDGRL